MIFFDPPTLFSKKFGPSSHLESDKIGPEGNKELLKFGKLIGMKEKWLQKRGTPDEHFDIFGYKIELAKKAGAIQLTRKEAIAKWKEKRKQHNEKYGKNNKYDGLLI